MSLLKTWYSGGNIPLPDISTVAITSKAMAWLIKATLKGEVTVPSVGPTGAVPSSALWTHWMSSDGVSTSLVTDLWGATFDETKIVRAAAGTAHSWIWLKSPAALGMNLILDFNGSSNEQQMSIIYSPVAFTGGTIQNRPANSTWEWVYANSTTFIEAFAVQNKLHFALDTEGGFYLAASRNTQNRWHFGMILQRLIGTVSNDLYPVVSFVDYNNAAAGASSGPWNSSNAGMCGTTSGKGRSYNGAVQTTLTALSYKSQGNAGSDAMSSITAVSPSEGKLPRMPIIVMAQTAGAVEMKGLLPDVGWAPLNFPQGQADPASPAAIEHIIVGNLYAPIAITPSL